MSEKNNEGIILKTVDKDVYSLVSKVIQDKQSNKSNKTNDMM